MDLSQNKITRNRPQLSCTACRRRKLKCDRKEPCDNCTRRSEHSLCTYLPFNAAQRQSKGLSRPRSRIGRLETLVTDLIEKVKQPTLDDLDPVVNGSFRQDEPASRGESTLFHVDNAQGTGQNSHSKLVSSSLWETILSELTEIQDCVDDSRFNANLEVQRVCESSPSVGFYTSGRSDIETIVASLPARHETDQLVATFFRFSHVLRPIVHPKKFQREYESFWAYPLLVPPCWLGLLFSMLRIATDFSIRLRSVFPSLGSNGVDAVTAATTFRSRTLECLSSASLHNPGIPDPSLYKLQTLLLHIEAEFMASLDSRPDTWVLSSNAVRIALRIGLHREPRACKDISPCDAEMRRRLWLGIMQCDIMMSFQVGLPAMIPWGLIDTHPPRNLRDDDFDEDSTELPASRPMSEATNISFFIAKQPLLHCFAQIASYSQEASPKDEIVALWQADLDRARNELPRIYQIRPIQDTLTEPSSLVMQRYAIDQTYQTAVCVLHRKQLYRAASNPEWSQSRRLCIDAALTLLHYQSIKYEESKPGGRFAGDTIMINSLDQNSFLLAAMLICIDLENRGSFCSESNDISLWGCEKGNEMQHAIETSMEIFNASEQLSHEASRASKTLASMLRRLTTYRQGHTPSDMTTADGYLTSNEHIPFAEDFDWLEFDRISRGLF
ncbi:conserved hypothetical protein [Paecilomyces variotii No. 5]|uniref:Zn(2)-C6 fungal-type domain-containing protein n=1 Tax=Byssochlamys spectabilis (strain No. 5 / NBRC 109023) TaxID=1356009 RepID=V5FVP1_BYSSN|nr:conserved hypothetical protein [Paecilomyces variotii No. 5]